MDTTTQIILVIMILVLGSTLTMVGIMFVFILKDFRETIAKANLIMDDLVDMSHRLTSSGIQLEEALISFRKTVDAFRQQAASPIGSLFGLINFVKSIWKHKEEGGDENE